MAASAVLEAANTIAALIKEVRESNDAKPELIEKLEEAHAKTMDRYQQLLADSAA